MPTKKRIPENKVRIACIQTEPRIGEKAAAGANLSDARRQRNIDEFNQILRDRRTDLYGEVLGADIARGWY